MDSTKKWSSPFLTHRVKILTPRHLCENPKCGYRFGVLFVIFHGWNLGPPWCQHLTPITLNGFSLTRCMAACCSDAAMQNTTHPVWPRPEEPEALIQSSQTRCCHFGITVGREGTSLNLHSAFDDVTPSYTHIHSAHTRPAQWSKLHPGTSVESDSS